MIEEDFNNAGHIANRIAERLTSAMVAHERHQVAPAVSASAPGADLAKAGYPPRSIHALENFHGPGADKANELVLMALKDGLLVLIGLTGRGKTVIATWLANRRSMCGKSPGKFITAYELFARMKQCWGKNEDSETVLATWKKTPFLVIDEAQTRGDTVWENCVLDELINYRYSHELPTIIIGNFDLENAQKSLGPRIMDRANECGGIVDCNWKSYR